MVLTNFFLNLYLVTRVLGHDGEMAEHWRILSGRLHNRWFDSLQVFDRHVYSIASGRCCRTFETGPRSVLCTVCLSGGGLLFLGKHAGQSMACFADERCRHFA